MILIKLVGLFVGVNSCFASVDILKRRNFDTHDYYTVHVRRGSSPETLARALGLQSEGQLGDLDDHYVFSGKRGEHSAETQLEDVHAKLKKRELVGGDLDGILWSAKSKLKPRLEKRSAIPGLEGRATRKLPGRYHGVEVEELVQKRRGVVEKLDIHDPIFNDQWHLINVVEKGHDINVTGVWLGGNTGQNATVAIIDDGLDMYSDDLKDNYFAEGSYDFNDHVDEPRPKLPEDHHGTRCAGEVAAVKNNVCGVGVAWNAKVAGIRILSKAISDEDEAVAINYGMQKTQIYSCSWGPPDNGKAMDAPSTLIKRSIQNGIQNGRGGLGSIFVFAAGNGAAAGDNCNFDGYTNSIYSITVGAIDRKGKHPYYSEKCSASLVVTYSSGSNDAIHTTDVGANSCYVNHGGTSAAAPLGAGILALVTNVRPDLHWRDYQYLVLETAVPVNEDEDWQKTYIGKKYSHTYAYGKLDAYTLVEAAKKWKSVKPQAWLKTRWQHVRHDIPQGDQGLASTFEVDEDMLKKANIERLEHVQVTVNIDHTRRGDLSVDLISPEGVVSHLSVTRSRDDRRAGYVNWTFMSVVHWGEPGIGKWTIIVKDTEVNEHKGKFVDWRMILWGECIDPTNQKLYPMPVDWEGNEHDIDVAPELEEDPETEDDFADSAVVSTTSITIGPSTSLPAQPTDHIDRPVNNKHPTSTASSISVPTSSTAASGSPSASSEPEYVLPSIFPTFGVSPRTQIWIYGAAGAILFFCAALGIFFCIWRRRRAQTNRDSYEFAKINTEDMDGAGGLPLARRDGGRRTVRAGELYDAFAGASDDEEIFSDAEDAQEYKDELPHAGSGEGSSSASSKSPPLESEKR